MRFHALATDYDGTIAHHGGVDEPTLDALQRFRDSGRKLLLVTGRELPDLQRVFPRLDVFHYVVAENGALLYDPATREEKCIAEPPPPAFLDELRRRNVPFSVGRSIVATVQPHEQATLDAIRDLGLELHVIFNKGAVMVLPSGMNKGVGLKAALKVLGLSPHNVVGVGDAENDHAFLSLCECSVATGNAIATLKERADIVLEQGWGAGVSDLISNLLQDELRSVSARTARTQVLVGADDAGELRLPAYGTNLLVAGPSGSGKSTAVTGILERLQEARYQFCLIDPEGDYDNFARTVTIGNAEHAPTTAEVLDMLDKFTNPVVNLLGIKLNDRPQFFAELVPKLQELRAHRGRPHWLVIDEAHHLLPAGWSRDEAGWLRDGSAILITVHPEMVSPTVLQEINAMLAVGQEPSRTLRDFGQLAGASIPAPPAQLVLENGEVLAWAGNQLRHIRAEPARTERLRHRRKYAAGDVQEKSFYFRGPEGKLNLRAQNLNLFVQIAEGVDDDTWEHHLRRRHYSAWVRDAIKDPELASVVAAIEESRLAPRESRRRIFAAIEERYTGAA